ncbi:MAG: TonB terminal, partial [Pseudomonadota bacterium]
DPTPKLPSAPEPPPRPEPTPEAEIALEKQKKAKAREAEKARSLEKKREEDKKRQEDRKKQAQRLEKERAAELKRLGLDPKAKPTDKGKDTTTKAGVANGSAKGERTGREAEWADRVKGLLESRVRYRGANTSDLEVEILLLPTGQLQSARLVTESNSPNYDQAVLDAIRAMTFPKPPDGLRAVTLKMRHRSD